MNQKKENKHDHFKEQQELETLLDEADKRAKNDGICLSHQEVFDAIRNKNKL